MHISGIIGKKKDTLWISLNTCSFYSAVYVCIALLLIQTCEHIWYSSEIQSCLKKKVLLRWISSFFHVAIQDDDSDLDYEIEALPNVTPEASAEAVACVKVNFYSICLCTSMLLLSHKLLCLFSH